MRLSCFSVQRYLCKTLVSSLFTLQNISAKHASLPTLHPKEILLIESFSKKLFCFFLQLKKEAKELALSTGILLLYGEDVHDANPYFHTVFSFWSSRVDFEFH